MTQDQDFSDKNNQTTTKASGTSAPKTAAAKTAKRPAAAKAPKNAPKMDDDSSVKPAPKKTAAKAAESAPAPKAAAKAARETSSDAKTGTKPTAKAPKAAAKAEKATTPKLDVAQAEPEKKTVRKSSAPKAAKLAAEKAAPKKTSAEASPAVEAAQTAARSPRGRAVKPEPDVASTAAPRQDAASPSSAPAPHRPPAHLESMIVQRAPAQPMQPAAPASPASSSSAVAAVAAVATVPALPREDAVTPNLPLADGQDADGQRKRRRPRRRPKKNGAEAGGASTVPAFQPVSTYDAVQPQVDTDPFSTQSKRHRSRRKRKPGGEQTAVFQPEAFADMYPSAMFSGGVLPGPHSFAHDLDDDFEDDGPQPALPNQPSLALPPALQEDEDLEALEALDAKVNGNRVDARGQAWSPATGRPGPDNRNQRGRQNQAKSGPKPLPAPAQAKAPVQAPTSVPTPAPAVQESPPAKPAAKAGAKVAAAPAGGKRVLYVSVIPEEQVEVVITDNNLVTEYFVEMAHQAKIRGNIYKGVINNVDTNLQAAFVNFGSGKNGFLQIDEVHPEYWLNPHDTNKGPKYPPIQKVLKVGQEVLVQVVKEPSGTKGAFLTTWISMAGRFLVLTPGQEQIGVSRKVEDTEERARLKELLSGIQPGEDMGVIIRTASEGASKTSIQKDLQYLKRLWKDIRKRVGTEKTPSLIYQEADLAARAVRDYLAEDIQEIWVDNESTLESIRETTSLLFPRKTDMVKLHQDPRQTLWERFNLQRQLEEVTSREVILPSGGRLVFDQTEALMAIDINSGKTQGKSNFEAMVFRTNMEAADAIARHLRLRDIGGQVVIDFIEMRDRNHCRDVEKALRNAMRLDRARHDVGRLSSFGLLELVRQRTGTSAISISSEPCAHCHGTGVRRNMEWQALHALRDLQCKLSRAIAGDTGIKGKNGKSDQAVKTVNNGIFQYETDYELGMYLLNRKRDRLVDFEAKFGLHIEIMPK